MIANAEVFKHLHGIDKDIDGILEIYVYLKSLMNDYDAQLMNVIGRHEEDFLTAYKTHMVKVEQQLQLLKDKAKEQENKLNNDERIVKMEKQLAWYRDEFTNLLKLKEKNGNEVDRVSANIDNLDSEKQYKQDAIKA